MRRLLTIPLKVNEPENWENQWKNKNLKAGKDSQNVDTSLYVNRLVIRKAKHTSSISHMLSAEEETNCVMVTQDTYFQL